MCDGGATGCWELCPHVLLEVDFLIQFVPPLVICGIPITWNFQIVISGLGAL